jgi:hypothetical protein
MILPVQVHHVPRRGPGNFLGKVDLTWEGVFIRGSSGEKEHFRLTKREAATRTSQKYVQGRLGIKVWVIMRPESRGK